jgi:hypothetical protein
MTAPVAAIAARKRRERDAADPVGAIARNQLRALIATVCSAIWGGAALIVVSTVAPAAFRVLPSRSLAGALVGQVLPVLFISGLVVGVLTFALVARGAPRVLLRRIGSVGVLGGCAIAQVVIGPKIAALRERIGPSVEALAVTDPLRVAFGQLHGLSVLSLGVAMVFALITLVASVLAVRDASSD